MRHPKIIIAGLGLAAVSAAGDQPTERRASVGVTGRG
jgi:hypothetical protein